MLESREAYTYKGATVLEPKKGIYHNLVVVDVISLYPTMAVCIFLIMSVIFFYFYLLMT